MRRIIILLALGLLVAGGASAQRALPGMRGVEVGFGAADGKIDGQNHYATLSIVTYAKNGNLWELAATYSQRGFDYDTGNIPSMQFSAGAGYWKKLRADPSKTVTLLLGGSALAGYETLNGGERLLPDGASLTDTGGFIYGLEGGLRLEGYVTDRIVLSACVRERALWGSPTGTFHALAGVGIRFMFH